MPTKTSGGAFGGVQIFCLLTAIIAAALFYVLCDAVRLWLSGFEQFVQVSPSGKLWDLARVEWFEFCVGIVLVSVFSSLPLIVFMAVLRRNPRFNVWNCSIIGGIVAAILLPFYGGIVSLLPDYPGLFPTQNLLVYGPVLLASGAFAGGVFGLMTRSLLDGRLF